MSVEHLFLTCNIYTEHRIQLYRGMRNLCFEIDIGNILFGNASFENDKNSELFLILSCIYIYPAISTFAVQICYTNKFGLFVLDE